MNPLCVVSDRLRVKAMRPGGIAYDLGANDGVMALSMAHAGMMVHAYEPVPDQYQKLIAAAASPIPAPGRIIPHHSAVSDQHGFLIGVNVFNTWSLLPDDTKRDKALDYAGKPPFNCVVTTLSSELSVSQHGPWISPPDFIKIDVDGFELRVLRGAEEAMVQWLDNAPPIQFEYSYLPTFLEDSIPEMVSLIYELGYQAYSMDGSFMCPEPGDMLRWYPEHTSFDIMLIHRNNRSILD